MIFHGNYDKPVYWVVNQRGFKKLPPNDEDSFAELDFIWKPTQFTPFVF